MEEQALRSKQDADSPPAAPASQSSDQSALSRGATTILVGPSRQEQASVSPPQRAGMVSALGMELSPPRLRAHRRTASNAAPLGTPANARSSTPAGEVPAGQHLQPAAAGVMTPATAMPAFASRALHAARDQDASPPPASAASSMLAPAGDSTILWNLVLLTCRQTTQPLQALVAELGAARRLLARAPAPNHAPEQLEHIQQRLSAAAVQAQRASEALRRLLSLQTTAPAPAAVQLNMALLTALGLVRPLLTAAGIEVALRTSSRMPTLWMSPPLLQQALVALLLTAEESMAPPGASSDADHPTPTSSETPIRELLITTEVTPAGAPVLQMGWLDPGWRSRPSVHCSSLRSHARLAAGALLRQLHLELSELHQPGEDDEIRVGLRVALPCEVLLRAAS